MPEENKEKTGNGKPGLLGQFKEDLDALKTDLPAKAKEQVEILSKPTKTQVYTSIFRHKHDDTPRNRALGVLSNVFQDRKSTRLNSSHSQISYAVFCLKK